MKCPICHSHQIETRHIGKTTGAIAGMILAIGALNTDISSDDDMSAMLGDISKNILAGVSGALVGADLGKKLDGRVFDAYKCAECGYTFNHGAQEEQEMEEVLFLGSKI